MCQIEITPDRLNRFPKTVPMNIREAILITGQALKRIREEAAKKAAAAGEKPQEPDPAPESQTICCHSPDAEFPRRSSRKISP